MQIVANQVWRSPVQGTLFECPVWHAARNTLYWIDVVDPSVHRYRFSDGRTDRWDLPKPPGSLALTKDGNLLVALRSGLLLMDAESGEQRPVLLNGPALEEDRFNDGVVDPKGNFWVGSMDRKLEKPIGRIFQIDSGMQVHAVPGDVRLANGLCFSPDGQFVYLSKTFEREIWRFRVEPAPELLADKTCIVKFGTGIEGRPDGCTIDSLGNLWSARVGGGAIDRYSPNGHLLDSLTLPTTHPTHCAFGGEQFDTLFVSTSRHGDQFAQMNAGKGDDGGGRIFGFKVSHRGLPPVPFG